MVTEAKILDLVKRLLNFPEPKICRHYVAANLLNILEESGYPISQELAGAVVNADDDYALNLLQRGRRFYRVPGARVKSPL